MSVAWNHGVVCIRSSRSVSWVSTCRSKWMIPRLPSSGAGRRRGPWGSRSSGRRRARPGTRPTRRRGRPPWRSGRTSSRCCRDREDVAEVGDGDRLAQVDAQLEAVRPVERGDLADALRAEPGAGAVGGAAVERGAEHGDVVLAAAAHVLEVGRLEEGVDAGEVRQLAAGERRDAPVDDGVRAGQAELEAAGDLLLPLGGRQLGLALDGVARPRGRSCRGPREGLRRPCRPADGGGSPTALLTSGAGRGAAGTTGCLPGFCPAVGGPPPGERSRLRLSDQAPVDAGRNPRRASPVVSRTQSEAPRVATGHAGRFRPVTRRPGPQIRSLRPARRPAGRAPPRRRRAGSAARARRAAPAPAPPWRPRARRRPARSSPAPPSPDPGAARPRPASRSASLTTPSSRLVAVDDRQGAVPAAQQQHGRGGDRVGRARPSPPRWSSRPGPARPTTPETGGGAARPAGRAASLASSPPARPGPRRPAAAPRRAALRESRPPEQVAAGDDAHQPAAVDDRQHAELAVAAQAIRDDPGVRRRRQS